MVRGLLAAGARVHRPDTGAGTPLYVAARNGSEEVVSALLGAGAGAGSGAGVGAVVGTPLYVASMWGNVEVVRALLAAGAGRDVNQPGNQVGVGRCRLDR